MRRIFFSLLLLSLPPLGIAALVWYGLEPAPRIETASTLSHQDVERARAIIAKNDPRQLKVGARRTLILEENDLNLAANHLVKAYGKGGARVGLKPGQLNLQASIRLPDNPINPYLNLALVIDENNGIASIADLHIGRVPVPGRLAELILTQIAQSIFEAEDKRLFKDVIKELSLSSGQLRITYKWKPGLISELKARLISPQDHERVRSYYSKLSEITRQPGLERRSSMMQILQPLFAYARTRSTNSDPVAENQAAIIVLAAYVQPGSFSALMPKTSDLPMPRRFALTLERRKDFAEHFLISAALASAGDAAISNAIGLYKEIADSKESSGFSFTDLAADRAGTRFGEVATASPTQARKVQKILAGSTRERDIMPMARDLPEHMDEHEFKRRFSGIGSPSFQKLKQEIEQRIAACRLYRDS